MANNTDQADINEILLGYYCLGGSWDGYNDAANAKKQLNMKKDKIGEDLYRIQSNRAKVMAKDCIVWAKKNGYKGKIKSVWWTARPGILSKAVGYEVDSRKNPTDTLLLFSDGNFLGLSAKSTAGSGDIGFKNPGIGTIDSALNISLKKVLEKEQNKFINEFKLDKSNSVRKQQIRKSPSLIVASNAARDVTLNNIRNSLLLNLQKLSSTELRDYLINDWMDAGTVIRPRYIKVTGHGNKPPFTTSIMDPLKNEKSEYMQSKPIKLEKIGNDSIGVSAGGKRIFKMRAKFESQAMASSIKFSGDPWK
jgi:hypothetical protein